MITIRVTVPASLADAVRATLLAEPGLTALSTAPSVVPVGTCFTANIPREHGNRMVEALRQLGVHDEGTIQLLSPGTWISRTAYDADDQAPGAASDAVIWAEVIERAYADTQLSWMFLTFMTLATLLAAIAVITDSVVLVIGAMVLGPEFTAVAALGLALVKRRPVLFRQAILALALGFAVSILLTFGAVELMQAVGILTGDQMATPRIATEFIATPNVWSLIIAFLAGVAGVLSLTAERGSALVGVFISVTTIPASGFIAVAAAFGQWGYVIGSAEQLVINITGMALAGWLTLALQQQVYARIPALRTPRLPSRTRGSARRDR